MLNFRSASIYRKFHRYNKKPVIFTYPRLWEPFVLKLSYDINRNAYVILPQKNVTGKLSVILRMKSEGSLLIWDSSGFKPRRIRKCAIAKSDFRKGVAHCRQNDWVSFWRGRTRKLEPDVTPATTRIIRGAALKQSRKII